MRNLLNIKKKFKGGTCETAQWIKNFAAKHDSPLDPRAHRVRKRELVLSNCPLIDT